MKVSYYDTVEIRNSTVYLIPNKYLKLYANTIYIDATSRIIADECGYLGGDGGNLGAGPGFGRYGYNGSGGGGAGHAGAGGAGGLSGANISGDEGGGGDSYGDNTSISFVLGSGGAGGGFGEGVHGASHQGEPGGYGGNGGGAVLLNAPLINVHGIISANGAAGSAGIGADNSSCGGGGGSGGIIIIQGDEVNLSSATLSANGGAGGTGGVINVGYGGGGGGGGVFLNAQQILVFGTIYANGAAGSSGIGAKDTSSGGGGGGSGGTIIIQGDDVNLSSATLSANSGAGGAGGTTQGTKSKGGGGGGGSGGRIKIFYGNSSFYDDGPEQDPSVALGAGGTAVSDALPGDNGSEGVFNETETAYITGIYYKESGYYESSVFNTSSPTTCYYNITWGNDTNDYTSLTVRVRTSIYEEMDDTMWENCDVVANGHNLTDLNSVFDWHQYIQYRVELFTYDETMTPVFYGVNITYNTSDPAGGSPVIAESTGMVKFKSGHIYYPKQEIAYEHGAVLKCQRERGEEDGIVIQPPPILIRNESGIPVIDISMINLTGTNDSYSGTTAISVEEENSDEPKTRSTKFHNLSLNITTEYPVIWGKWFNDTLAESGLNESRYEVIETEDYVVADFYGDEQHVHLVEVDKTDVEVTLAT